MRGVWVQGCAHIQAPGKASPRGCAGAALGPGREASLDFAPRLLHLGPCPAHDSVQLPLGISFPHSPVLDLPSTPCSLVLRLTQGHTSPQQKAIGVTEAKHNFVSLP